MQLSPDQGTRFDAKVEKSEGCWLWTAGRADNGYGKFFVNGKSISVHRISYERAVGPIPDGLVIDHLCRVRHCVNPAHMEVVTTQENIRRGEVGARERSKTHCPKGHAYDEANTWFRGDGARGCRTCNRENQQALRDRRAAVA